MNTISRVLDAAQRTLARMPAMVRLAVLIRNQCRCIIKYHLAESPDVNETGEVWLREVLAPQCFSFVDVGANIGDWLSDVRTQKHGAPLRALAFEPSTSAFERLSARFGGDPQVTLVNCALADMPGEAQFFEEDAAGKGSSIVADFNRSSGVNRAVKVSTLDDEIASRGWDGIDFLKIDAEGYDFRVLKGALALLAGQRIGVLQFEYNRSWQLAGDTLFAAMALLKSHGYEVYVLKRDGVFTLNYKLYEEYYEYSNYVAVSPRFSSAIRLHYRGTI